MWGGGIRGLIVFGGSINGNLYREFNMNRLSIDKTICDTL